MEIKKGNINLCEQVAKGFLNVLVEGDLIVPDTKPDMAEILAADAKVNISADEYRNGALNVKGEVLFTALYVAEGENGIKSIEQSLPFSESVELKRADGSEYSAKACVEHIGFTLVNSRKLAAKVMVSISACATQNKEYEPVIEVSGDDIESRNKKYSIYVPLSETDTEIEVSDILTVPQEKPDIGEILKVDAYVVPCEVRVMTEKAMVHAELRINTLYTAADSGMLTGVCHTVPFTEVIEAPGADEQSVVYVSYKLDDIFAACKGDLKGDTKIISAEAKITAKAKVSRAVAEQVVDDCYLIKGKTDVTRENMSFFEYITSENTRVPVRIGVEAPKNTMISEIIDCCVKPYVRECTWENGTAEVKGAVIATLIYCDGDGKLHSAVAQSDVNWQKTIADRCSMDADLWIEDVNCEISGGSVQILVNTGIYAKALKPCRVSVVTDIQTGDENITNQPSMAVYFVKEGDTLWSVAKKYRTKAEKIKNINNLDNDKLEKGRRLLIPKA